MGCPFLIYRSFFNKILACNFHEVLYLFKFKDEDDALSKEEQEVIFEFVVKAIEAK